MKRNREKEEVATYLWGNFNILASDVTLTEQEMNGLLRLKECGMIATKILESRRNQPNRTALTELNKEIKMRLGDEFSPENQNLLLKGIKAADDMVLEGYQMEGQAARNTVIEHYYEVAVAAAISYKDKGVQLEDIVQETILELTETVETMDFRNRESITKGYISQRLRLHIRRTVLAKNSLIISPVASVQQSIGDSREEHGKNFEQDDEINTASESHTSPMIVESFDLSRHEKYIAPSMSTLDLINEGIFNSGISTLVHEIGNLTDRERQVIRRRYKLEKYPNYRGFWQRGIGYVSPEYGNLPWVIFAPKKMSYEPNPLVSLRAIGEEFNVSPERIRQIEAKIMRKLRQPRRVHFIKDYCEGYFVPNR